MRPSQRQTMFRDAMINRGNARNRMVCASRTLSLSTLQVENRLAVTYMSAMSSSFSDPLYPYLLATARYRRRQEDASEFLADILDEHVSPTLAPCFQGRLQQTLECSNNSAHRWESAREDFTSLSLPLLRPNGTLIADAQSALDFMLSPELFELDGSAESRCRSCGCTRLWKHCAVTRPPRVLMLIFKRWAQPERPLFHRIRVDEQLVLSGYQYRLVAVVSHLGKSMNHGHYIAVVRHAVDGGSWWIYDDHEVRLAQPEEVSTMVDAYHSHASAPSPMHSYVAFYEAQ